MTTDKEEVKKRLKEIEEKSKKKNKISSEELGKLITTRAKLERDYKEDIIEVEFKTSPQTTRKLEVRRPNNEQYIELLNLVLQASKFQKSMEAEDIVFFFQGFQCLTKDKAFIAEKAESQVCVFFGQFGKIASGGSYAIFSGL